LAGGQNIWSLKITADYSFSKKPYGYILLWPFISQSSDIDVHSHSNIRSGFTLRYNFGN
jgi:hypothetical protein